ncbi:MAG: hypothetical protein A3J65_02405 [Candidatus Buchananbacteria bacterium RIFCSPHIGHO2_02_FULL_45_11b]|uniref:GTA TIM-barrel-like domain-containing protein n=2 Tax=Candidatus Buchananiibacteriota TaxID=1817903 RepID=A0A1G1YHF8_9BACT|nr:MAG: hypothetical protein A3J65_02405 [Candidatus Buchananbacteria bacterium RIFCSPHIGHO2_02_FULL_45_11b]OGY57860.1 MAG: hypothetical protein A3H67_03185 [Candidatus Buchananbacteria bacterium RIFCSPLOWO2_02_FULL_46_11b]
MPLTITEVTCAETITPPDSKIKGMNFCSWWNGQYTTMEGLNEISNIYNLRANWISVVTTVYQDQHDSTVIYLDLNKTMDDANLAMASNRAHCLGLAVILKIHVDLANDPAYWRGQITFLTEEEWQAWFASYRQMIYHYADLAEQLNVELFIIGTELAGTSTRAADWQEIIAGIRARYSGLITYAANWDGEADAIAWWPLLDLIGLDAYYPLSSKLDPTVEELKTAWQPIAAQLEALSLANGRPVMFTEIGYASQDGTSMHPYSYSGVTLDLQEQADCYQAALETFWDKPWFRGFLWWYWQPLADQGGVEDLDYTPRGKPAEDVLRTFCQTH